MEEERLFDDFKQQIFNYLMKNMKVKMLEYEVAGKTEWRTVVQLRNPRTGKYEQLESLASQEESQEAGRAMGTGPSGP